MCLKGVRADVMSATPGWFAVLVVIGFPMGLLTDRDRMVKVWQVILGQDG